MLTHVLLIEDEAQIRENLMQMLILTGYKVSCASNGVDGITMAIQQPPDLILCDIMMPQMGGYQVLESIRTDPVLADTPFIFLTAKADMVDLRMGMTLGADDYLTKPFALADLLAALESRLKRQQHKSVAQSPTVFKKTIQGNDEKGVMILHTEDCLYFFCQNRRYFVRHQLGTFRIDLTIEKLAAELDPAQFFRVNRHVILHRKTVRNYTYWDKGKYCLFLELAGQVQEATLPRARFNSFKDWLSGWN